MNPPETTENPFILFTKPWKNPVPEVAEIAAGFGFDGVEYPVRPGYPVDPDNVTTALPIAARQFADRGLTIGSVAADPTPEVIAACGEVGAPIVRICAQIKRDETYLEGELRLRREWDALVPLLDDAGVTLGIQNHSNRCVPNALAVRRLIEHYDSKHVALVWDPAHEALDGQNLDLALDVGFDLLCLVNLKNATWQRTNAFNAANAADAAYAEWRSHWTTGRHGLASWSLAISELKRRGYRGPLCICAEYSDETELDALIAEDLAFAKELLAGE